MKRIMAIILLAALLLAGCAGKETTWQEQYDLGVRYLSEGNYDEAILAFTQAIEIDSRNAEAYLSRAAAYLAVGGEEAQSNAAANYIAAADLYIQQGDSERAEQVLKEALEMMGANQQIADKLEEICRACGRLCLLPRGSGQAPTPKRPGLETARHPCYDKFGRTRRKKPLFCRFPAAEALPSGGKTAKAAAQNPEQMYIEKGEPYALYNDFGGQKRQPRRLHHHCPQRRRRL